MLGDVFEILPWHIDIVQKVRAVCFSQKKKKKDFSGTADSSIGIRMVKNMRKFCGIIEPVLLPKPRRISVHSYIIRRFVYVKKRTYLGSSKFHEGILTSQNGGIRTKERTNTRPLPQHLQSQYQPPRNPFRGLQGPHGLPKIHPVTK